MTATPRTTVDDSYPDGLHCAICGQPSLFVQHLPNYPDFVTCRNCQSAFVVEDTGERVMYGKIPDDYPETREFALRQWVWLEAVERRAREERPLPPAAEPPEMPEDSLRMMVSDEVATETEDEAAPAAAPGPDADWLAARLMASELTAGVPIPTEPDPYRGRSPGVPLGGDTGPTDDSLPAWLRDEAAPTPAPVPAPPQAREVPPPPPVAPPPAGIAPAPVAATAAAAVAAESKHEEPPANRRHRVFLRGDRVRMPVNACAHCQRTPAPDRLPVPGSLPRSGPTGRRQTTFKVPLCRECSNRSRVRSPEQRSARLMAHLIGALVGLVLIVAVLALNVIRFSSGLALGLVLLGAIGLVGYGFTAGILVGRAGRIPPPPDAAFVRTTLRVAAEPGAPVTAFEWRSPQFAASFHQANRAVASGEPVSVADEATSP